MDVNLVHFSHSHTWAYLLLPCVVDMSKCLQSVCQVIWSFQDRAVPSRKTGKIRLVSTPIALVLTVYQAPSLQLQYTVKKKVLEWHLWGCSNLGLYFIPMGITYGVSPEYFVGLLIIPLGYWHSCYWESTLSTLSVTSTLGRCYSKPS